LLSLTLGDVTANDLVAQAVAELYSADPEEFTKRRNELAAQARSAGDRTAAKQIATLGKPTRSAWVVNRLIRADPGVAAALADLGDRLRAGEAALDGASIRELSRARRDLIDELVRKALKESGQQSASAALRDEISETFSAALADPDVAEQVAAGRLVRAARWAGFGPGIGTAPVPAGAGPKTPDRPRRAAGAKDEADTDRDREQQRREAIAAAEQAVAEATTAAEAAAAAERETAESVRFMEERLNREQQRLIQARRDSRDARAALSRARQTLDRLARRGQRP
jgi:hypothetical protein